MIQNELAPSVSGADEAPVDVPVADEPQAAPRVLSLAEVAAVAGGPEITNGSG